MWELLSNTVLLMVFVTLFAIILGTLCAFLLERYRFWEKAFPSRHDAPSLYSGFCQLFYVDQSHLQSGRLVGNHRYYDAEFFPACLSPLLRQP